MAHIIPITDANDPRLDVFARLTEAQLRNKLEPEKGVFIAESPKVIALALDAGYTPLALLMEERQLEAPPGIFFPAANRPRSTQAPGTCWLPSRAMPSPGGCCVPFAGRPCLRWRTYAPAPGGWRCWKAS